MTHRRTARPRAANAAYERDAANARVTALEVALAFYADAANWQKDGGYQPVAIRDGGDTARAALAQAGQ